MDYNELRQLIKSMNRRSAIYKLLKEELSIVGYWKLLPRGNPSKAGSISSAKRKNTI